MDVLSYVLSVNKLPAGDVELPRQSELLAPIKFLAQKPSGDPPPKGNREATMKNHPITVSRRGFLARSATAGALGCLSGTSVAASPLAQSGDDAIVAAQISRFVKKSVKDLPTPALLINLDIFEHNLQALASYMKGRAVTFRPHGKAHKVACGREAAAGLRRKGFVRCQAGRGRRLIRGGIKDVLITAEVVGKLKIERLMSLSR